MIGKLSITVDYGKDNGDPEMIERLLISAARHLVSNGLLTQETDLEVEEWSIFVTTKESKESEDEDA